jgi:hypothetical protein
LNYLAERLKDRVIKNRSKEEVDVFQIDSIVSHFLFQFDLVLVTGILLSKVDISLVDENKNGAIVYVFLFKV